MKKGMKIIACVLGAVIAVGAAAAGIYMLAADKGPFSGTVTENGNPVAGVSVTDGRNVVKTDENGSFELDGWRKSRFVTVTVPSGYATDEFYIPVEHGRESYDFSLEKSSLTAQEQHCFLQISDTEIGENGTGEWLESLKEIIKENNPAFLIHTGDICYEEGLKRHIQDMNTQSMGCTVRYAIGNHDYVSGKYGEELYESIYGPVWYSFDVGNVHYIVTPFQSGGDYKSGYGKNDRWKWLKNDLENTAPDKKIVMFNHTNAPSDDYVISFGREELDLKQHNLIAWIFGHYHYNYVYEKGIGSDSNGILNISAPRPDCGGIDSSAAGTRIISMDENGVVTTQMKYYDLGKTAEPENAVWKTRLHGNILFCDTVYDNGRIYTATADDDYPHSCGIYCLNAENGEIIWQYETGSSVKNNICIDGSSLLAMDVRGEVYCLDKENGNEIWSVSDTDLMLGNFMGTSSGICVQNGMVYVGGPRAIAAMDISSGAVKWSVRRNSGENSPAEFVAAGGRLLVNSHWDSLTALNSADGRNLWDNKDEDLRFRSSTPIAVDDNTILAADDDAIMLIDAQSGEIISKTVMQDYSFSSSAQPAVDNGVAYIPTSNKGIIAFSLAQKQLLWSFETNENILFTAPYKGKGSKTVEATPVLDSGKLVFGANDGYVYVLNAQTGDVISSYFAGSAVLGKAALSETGIYAGTFDGCMVCFENKD